MRKAIELLLPMLGLLTCAAMASAHVISVTKTSGGYDPSDTLTVDVIVDTEGELWYGFTMYVDFDPAVLSANESASVQHLLPKVEGPTSLYLYPNSWYIKDESPNVLAAWNGSIATLVFHVINPAVSTWITPVLDRGEAIFLGYDPGPPPAPTDASDEVTINALQVPEPAAIPLVLSAIGTLALLRARRGRVR